MQATLSARPKTILDIVPRPQPEVSSRSAGSARKSKDDFASKLSEARSDWTQDAPEKKPTPAAEDAASTKKAEKPSDSTRRVDKTKTRDDAATESEKTTAPTEEAAAKPATDAEAGEGTAEDSAQDGEVVADGKPGAEEGDPEAAAAALAAEAALLNAQMMPIAPVQVDAQPQAEVVESDEEAVAAIEQTTAVVATAAVAANAAANPLNAVDEESDAEAAGSNAQTQVNPALVQATAEEASKSKDKTSGAVELKVEDLERAPVELTKVAAQRPADQQEQQSDAQSGKQQEAALLASKAGKEEPNVVAKTTAESTFDTMLAKLTPSDIEMPKPPTAPTPQPAVQQPTVAPEQRFAADNIDNVVKGVRTQIEAGGNGQMRMRLDPPELGALDVAVKMMDGRMTATFTTNNDEATQLLSHSLNNLKHSLEASGITVDRIQVRQTTTDNNAQQQPGNNDSKRENGSAFDQQSQRGDQQRKEAVEKMWRKLAYGSDELDFVA